VRITTRQHQAGQGETGGRREKSIKEQRKTRGENKEGGRKRRRLLKEDKPADLRMKRRREEKEDKEPARRGSPLRCKSPTARI
jgi:hypothetical protein